MSAAASGIEANGIFEISGLKNLKFEILNVSLGLDYITAPATIWRLLPLVGD